jgi:hypothetical protein
MVEQKEILVDVQGEKQGMVRTPKLHYLSAGLAPAFRKIDDNYRANPRQYLEETVGDIEEIKVRETGQAAKCSFIYDENTAKAREVLVVFAPFSDVEPKSSIDKILNLLKILPSEISQADLMLAQPHSYNQAVKSKTIHDLLKIQFFGMPVITIFGLMHPKVYGKNERSEFRDGDFIPAGQVVQAAVSKLEDRLHSPKGNHIQKIHFNGLSLGASNARGAAVYTLYRSELQVGSLTAQESITGPDKFPRTLRQAGRFGFRQQVNRPVTPLSVSDHPKIHEPHLRRKLIERGNEVQMIGQMLVAMSHQTFLRGLTKSRLAKRNLIDLDKAGVPVTLANAYNSGLSEETQEPLRIGGFTPLFANQQKLLVKAIEGKRIGHELNELVTPSATIALAGIEYAAKRD